MEGGFVVLFIGLGFSFAHPGNFSADNLVAITLKIFFQNLIHDNILL